MPSNGRSWWSSHHRSRKQAVGMTAAIALALFAVSMVIWTSPSGLLNAGALPAPLRANKPSVSATVQAGPTAAPSPTSTAASDAARLRTQLASAQAKLQTAWSNLGSTQATLGSTKSQLGTAQSKLGSAQDQLASARSRVSSLESQIAALEAKPAATVTVTVTGNGSSSSGGTGTGTTTGDGPANPGTVPQVETPVAAVCTQFTYQQDAQAALVKNPVLDRATLDGNNDGLACGDLPSDPNRPKTAAVIPVDPQPTAPTKAALLNPTMRYFGLYTTQSPFNWAEFNDVSAEVGQLPNMDGYFGGFDQDYRPDVVIKSWQRGMLPFLTWESRPNGASNSEKDFPAYANEKIIDGSYDAYLKKYADSVKSLGLPIAIRFDHEMNGNWYSWSDGVNGNAAGSYVKMWQHVHDVFQQEGANQYVIWVWSPNIINRLTPSSHKDASYLASMYPGDAYVDWTGMSGYWRNHGTATFDGIYGSTLTQVRGISAKPIVLSEIGATDTGGEKADFIDSLWAGLAEPANKDIIGIAWFNHVVTSKGKTNDWRLDATHDDLAAFKAGVTDKALNFGVGTR